MEIVFEDEVQIKPLKIKKYRKGNPKLGHPDWNKQAKCWNINVPCDSKDDPEQWWIKQLDKNNKPTLLQYMVYQKEKGDKKNPETLKHYIHWNVLVEFIDKKKGSFLWHNILNYDWHFEKAKSDKRLRDYCMKEETRLEGPFEFGQFKGQGFRSDLDEIMSKIDSKQITNLSQIRREYPQHYVQYHRSFERALNDVLNETKRCKQIVELHIGVPGAGKTYACKKFCNDHNIKFKLIVFQDKKEWFCSYKGQRAIIFDEFRGQIELPRLNTILDELEPVDVPIKGGTTYLQNEYIFITTNRTPEEWYPDATPEEIAALYRRFTTVKSYLKPFSRDITERIKNNKAEVEKFRAIQYSNVEEKKFKKFFKKNPVVSTDDTIGEYLQYN